MAKEKILNIIRYLSLAGIVVAGYSLYQSYFGDQSAFCNINSTLNCFNAYHSGYSKIFGLPIALYGLIGFGLIFVSSTRFLLPLTFISFALSFYFFYLSAFVIKSWCIVCIVSWVIIWMLFVLAMKIKTAI